MGHHYQFPHSESEGSQCFNIKTTTTTTPVSVILLVKEKAQKQLCTAVTLHVQGKL